MTFTAPSKAPFPWFGGKRRVAAEMWTRFGVVDNYVEPFAGSLAVLLAAPRIAPTETVNDADGLLANFWRAMTIDPEAVAHHADWPINEADLHARHLWLVGQRDTITAKLMADPDWCDPRAAGWWVWGACSWIGGGWCSGNGPWVICEGEMTHHLGDAGRGIHRQLPHLGNAGQGIHRQLPHLGDAGRGSMPARQAHIMALAARLSRVRVACGDWSRVVGPSVTYRHGITAVLLDPPYETGVDVYAQNSRAPAAESWAWACAHGNNPLLRIAYCCHDDGRALPSGWTRHAWKAVGGYGSQGDSDGRANAAREVVFFSPHCIGQQQPSLFNDVTPPSPSPSPPPPSPLLTK